MEEESSKTINPLGENIRLLKEENSIPLKA